jgi:hypothetical protein
MKIVATVGESRVLVEMTGRELANIVGKTYENQLSNDTRYTRLNGLEVGTQYDVSTIYNRLRKQEDAAATIEQGRKAALALAEMFQCLDLAAVIVAPKEQEESK